MVMDRIGSKKSCTYRINASIAPISSDPPSTQLPPMTMIIAIADPDRKSTIAIIMSPSLAARLLADNISLALTSNRSRFTSSLAIPCTTLTPLMFSASAPAVIEPVCLAYRNALFAMGNHIARTIASVEATAMVSNASRQSMITIATMIPASRTKSPTLVTKVSKNS